MARTLSTMMALGTKAPDFELLDVISGDTFGLSDVKGEKGLVVMFICVHCPYVILVQDELAAIAKEYKQKGIGFVAISSNDVMHYPQDGPEKMKEQAELMGFSFPYLFDESQVVAKAYDAACTPDLFVFDGAMNCYYRGRLDEATPGNGKEVTGVDLRKALDALLKGMESPENQIPSMGCNIKWKQ